MAWIETIKFTEADETLRRAIADQNALYPKEYARSPNDDGSTSIVATHTLFPDTLFHAFATFGTLMSPDLPLTRRQHEMITTRVSALNRCVY